MKVFNPEKELRKIQHGNKSKIIFGIMTLLLIISIGSTYALYQVRYSKRIIYTKVAPFSNNKDLNLAVYVNGKPDELPGKNIGYKYSGLVCDNGSVVSQWNDEKWELEFLSTVPIPNKCNVYFVTDEDYNGEKIEYTGDVQEYKVPKTGKYKIELWGAGGGKAVFSGYTFKPGQGGYTAGIIELEKNDKLYFYVGAKGNNGVIGAGRTSGTSFNGGGYGIGANDNDDGGGGGGGATDVRLEKGETWDDFNSLKSRIMIAAGGGGSSGMTTSSPSFIVAGSAGGLNGVGNVWSFSNVNEKEIYNATQTTGYKFGIGGNGISASGTTTGGGGGGGGYYGGWNDSNGQYPGSGGGGSSFISGHEGCKTIDIEKSTDANNIVPKDTSIHDSGKVFTNTVMIDGLGYYWTDKRETYIGMPTTDGTSIMEGNTGNGSAKITYLG